MIDFTEYVVSELKSKRLSKTCALSLIKQFYLTDKNNSVAAFIHPLLHRNTSTLTEQCYSTRFTGEEFFLKDHQINGQKVLPGVAYLEMVRAAITNCLPYDPHSAVIELHNHIWAQPIVVTESKEVVIALFLNDEEPNNQTPNIAYEIYSLEKDVHGNEKEIIHSQGQALIIARSEYATINSAQLSAQMNRGTLTSSDVYESYEKIGLCYGPSHRAVIEINQGIQQLTVKLSLPEVVKTTFNDYILHPSLMDAVLQSAIGFIEDISHLPEQPSLPFAIESLCILSPCTTDMFAWLRYAPGSKSTDKFTKVDIDVCDSEGNVCVQIRGFTSRQLDINLTAQISESTGSVITSNGKGEQSDGNPQNGRGELYAIPQWQPKAIENEIAKNNYAENLKTEIILCRLPSIDAANIESHIANSQCSQIKIPTESDLTEVYCSISRICFEKIKHLFEGKLETKSMLQVVITTNDSLLVGLKGLLKTASIENPLLVSQLIVVDSNISPNQLIHILEIEKNQQFNAVVKYDHETRYTLGWEKITKTERPSQIAFKDSGVYLITGGLGGLGVLFAREIATKTNAAKIILTGRSALTESSKLVLDSICQNTGTATKASVEYRQMDVTQANHVEELISNIIEHHGQLSGIIHAAGVIDDNFILKKTSSDFQAVLAPKVLGAFNLDTATSNISIDFFALFSSVSSSFGNPGQADYACANGFMDQYAAYRDQLVVKQLRMGKTISINWPLWQDGGMVLDQSMRDALMNISGMQPITSSKGVEAFYQILQGRHAQTLVMQGDLHKLHMNLLDESTIQDEQKNINPDLSTAKNVVNTTPLNAMNASAKNEIAEKTRDYLRQQLSISLKLPTQKIDVQAALEKYGIDSILSMNITNDLEKTFGSLPKTLFFEYQSVAQLAEYFLKNHQNKLISLFGGDAYEHANISSKIKLDSQQTSFKILPTEPNNSLNKKTRRSRFINSTTEIDKTKAVSTEPIAIVGLSGRYPEAPNLDIYWENLKSGKDCITEVPISRWDWREYYSEDRRQEGHHFSKWGGFIEGVDEFDPRFFNISPLEAEYIDPQERLFLQHVWMAVEDAGLTRASLQIAHDADMPGQVGVYAGVMYSEYQLFGAEASMRGKRKGVAGSFASIANRVSYVLNLHGPSMTLDTMCSSSLTAIHIACQDLKQGRTDAAIAGGVNISIHPSKYLVLSAGQFISSEGHCQSFGEGGDGYIPGEGVGVVVLKRLSDAERDGHHIYGLIKGSALNHGGKTNGYSVPNPQAQTSAINRALAEAQIDPRHISYIEAHGTGTKLGDPIEISALTKAFYQSSTDGIPAKNTPEIGYCLIGSAKSNIGHCESAAGIAGLTKILLQLQHKKIAPSLHSSKLNPYIDFNATPFIVNQELTDWNTTQIDGTVVPRIAGISSFGAGGSNAHIIIEDYVADKINEPIADAQDSTIILLSARTATQLQQKSEALLSFLRGKNLSIDLPSLSYTLQVGREAMDERMAIIVKSVAHLADKLQAFINGDDAIADLYRGRVETDTDGISTISQDDDMSEAIDKWITRKKFSKLLEFWVKGLWLDWNSFYVNKPKLISLPTYPFARERYWISDLEGEKRVASGAVIAGALHPLVHKNISDLTQQQYLSVFTGEEFYLRDHLVTFNTSKNQKILPAVAYLEMARSAVEQASPITQEFEILELHNTVWVTPLVVNAPREVVVALQVQSENSVGYEIVSREIANDDYRTQDTLHCQGLAVFSKQPAPPKLDLTQIKDRIGEAKIDAETIYGTYENMGISYGPSFKSILALQRGQDELLTELHLPSHLTKNKNEYILHPSLLDAALQASLGLVGDLEHLDTQPILPFALESMRIIFACSEKMFAWTRFATASRAGDALIKLDIDICDEAGNICVQMRGLTSRQISMNAGSYSDAGSEKTIMSIPEVLFATPSWKQKSVARLISGNHAKSDIHPNFTQHHIFISEEFNSSQFSLTGLFYEMDNIHVSHFPSVQVDNSATLAKSYQEFASYFFTFLQDLFKEKIDGKVFIQIVLNGEQKSFQTGISGLLKTASIENPNILAQLILIDTKTSTSRLKTYLLENKHSPYDTLIRYSSNKREVFDWHETSLDGIDDEIISPCTFKENGVYLITGGLGGLGLTFAQEIITHTKNSKIILTGRSPSSEKTNLLLSKLSAENHQIIYRQVDISNLTETRDLIKSIQQDFQTLNGVLHSAGMTADSFILKKDSEEFNQVLEPKVIGTVNLDEATKDISLDFMVFFSSVSAVLGNPGQADYAAANGFMDQFSAQRNEWVKKGIRGGQTLSINWPLWHAGGMQMDSTSLDILMRVAGVQPMQTSTGMKVFHRSLALKLSQSLVMEGNLEKMRHTLYASSVALPVRDSQLAQDKNPAHAQISQELKPNNLAEKTQDYLRKLFSTTLKLSADEIDPKVALEKYGIDSIVAMKLTNELENLFGSLSKTLLFEYQNIADLATYLTKNFPHIILEKIGVTGAQSIIVTADAKTNTSQLSFLTDTSGKSRFLPTKNLVSREVAIVGLSGKYPHANNLDEFWKNLQEGRDCISEIPPERWGNSRFFSEQRNQAGKTYSNWGGFISDVDKFDPLFFSISPKEAELIDPQERLFLQTVWQTIEDAGYSKERIAANKKVGVYVGVMWGHYELFGADAIQLGGTHVPTSSYASIANRVSYYFDFHGPSIALDTMCSSSITAIHLACEAIRSNEIDMAIAGGVNLSIHPQKYLNLSQGNFSASDGRCRSFGANGDGYVPGEGVGAVLLKSLDEAIADGDQIYAVIKSTSINHGGKTNGYTVPNPNAQGELILDALKKARVEPNTLSYIEAHGTGTSLGDPIEITGLKKAFEHYAMEKQSCPIGSVKSNIGHLESAAGIAAITKALLQLKHNMLVPSLHADPLNPNIDFENSPFYVQRTLTDWTASATQPRRIGVSSFGAGGSNGHIILEEFKDTRLPIGQTGMPEAVLISARNREALLRYVENFVSFLSKPDPLLLADIAYTTQIGRTPLKERLVVIASDINELTNKLTHWLASQNENTLSSDVNFENIFHGNLKENRQDSPSTFIQGDAGKAFLNVVLENNDLGKIAKLWVAGVDIDWLQLSRHTIPKKISLPTYPFAKERYWVKSSALSTNQVPAQGNQQLLVDNIVPPHIPLEEKSMLYYHPVWTQTSFSHSTENLIISEQVLIIDTSDRLFLAVNQYITDSGRGAGNTVIWVKPDIENKQHSENTYSISFDQADAVDAFIKKLKQENKIPQKIIYNSAAQDEQATGSDFFALTYLLQSLLKQKQSASTKLIAILSNPTKITQPAHAALAGLFKTLSLENPKYSGKVIEILNRETTAIADDWMDVQIFPVIINELFQDKNWTDNEIRYQVENQKLVRYVRQLVAYYPTQKSEDMPIKHQGVYIISGGLGGLGYIFSSYLAKNFQAKLILCGRSEISELQQEKLNSLTEFKAEAIYVQSDIENLSDVEKLIETTKMHFGEINGVIHSAGAHRDSFLLKKTTEEMITVLAPKLRGTINLDAATSNENLDFFVMFSSLAGITGNLGQSDYAYANHFMDSFAEVRDILKNQQKRKGKTLSINWPFWEEGGMSLSENNKALMAKQTGINPLNTKMGLDYWEFFLKSSLTQGIAVYGNPEKIRAYFNHKPANTVSVSAPQLISHSQTKSLAIEIGLLKEKTQHYLTTLIGKEIQLAPELIDTSEPFNSFGIDSIIINKINVKLEEDFGDLPKTLFYEYETISELTDYLTRDKRHNVTDYFSQSGNYSPGNVWSPRFENHTVNEQSNAIKSLGTETVEINSIEKNRVEASEENEAIAIIGVHGVYPQSSDLNEFWQNLKDGKDLVDLVPFSRWDYEDYYDPDPSKAAEGKIYCKWGGFLKDFDKFDPAFFNIAPADAKMIDPQERIFLQSVWCAFENAGYTRERLKKLHPINKSANVGVFVGVTTNSYQLLGLEERDKGNLVNPASLPWSIANRVSYFFDFQGPSMPVDTACSSSLVAIDLACDSLRKGNCQVAVAGGVNLYLHPSKYQTFCQRRMISIDGKTRSFGAGEEGFVPSEGVGTLILKPLSRAEKDGDIIYGIIRGSGYEHSGRSNGYSAPNPNSQASLISRTLAKAHVHPETIGYVEGHGTGTQLGDSLEISALTNAFQLQTSRKQFCAVGSVKANMGHPEAVAGIAGIAKILLQFKHQQFVPSINSEQVNPQIDFENSPFYLQHNLTPWVHLTNTPRRAMINSFGSGGVNACVILEEYAQRAPIQHTSVNLPYVFTLSAKNTERLNAYVQSLLNFFESEIDLNLADLAYSLQIGREPMQERLAVVAKDKQQLIQLLTNIKNDDVDDKSENIYRGSVEGTSGVRKISIDPEALSNLFDSKNLGKLAELWVRGERLEWENLYPHSKPIRIAAPTYPFAKDRYWVTDVNTPTKHSTHSHTQLHPLLSYNSSNLKDVSFTSHLSVNEFYAKDHQINGKTIFPGAGFLEMACISGAIAGVKKVRKIQDIVWIQPLLLQKEPEVIQISLKPNGDNADFWITSLNSQHEKVIHSEGIISFKEASKNVIDADKIFSINGLIAQCTETLDGELYYQQFENAGFNYGTSFQTIQKLYLNENYALAKIQLAGNLKDSFDEYILHPCMLDGALQTAGAMVRAGNSAEPYVPFAIGELEILNAIPTSCYVYVELADSNVKPNADVKKFNIKLLNERGHTLIRINNFCVRALTHNHTSKNKVTDTIS